MIASKTEKGRPNLFRIILAALACAQFCVAADPEIVFPYGAVYFRKSNPPEKTGSATTKPPPQIGMNMFRHWVMWSAVEVAPGKFDWRDYDRMMDLEGQNGIQAVLAEIITPRRSGRSASFPKPASRPRTVIAACPNTQVRAPPGGSRGSVSTIRRCALARRTFSSSSRRATKTIRRSTATISGTKETPAAARARISRCASSAHIPNEHRGTNVGRMYCYCPASIAEFRKWLLKKYGTSRQLARAWRRYSFATWDDVQPSRTGGPYPDWLDWLEFKEDRAHELLRWRSEIIRSVDHEAQDHHARPCACDRVAARRLG